MAENIVRPDPAGYVDTIWTDQNGKQWIADSKGRWNTYVEPPEAGGGASSFADLTDKVTAPIATTNTSIADALALLAPKASPTFTGTVTIPSGASISGYLTSATASSTYAPISTKGMRTFADESALMAATPDFIGQIAYAEVTETLWTGVSLTAGGWSGTLTAQNFGGSGGDLTDLPAGQLTGNIAVARIATALTTPGPIGGTTASSGAFTTVTASGAVSGGGSTLNGINLVMSGDARLSRRGGGAIMLDQNGTANALFVFASNTTSGVALKRNGTALDVTLGDGTGAGSVNLLNLTASGTVKAGTYTVGTTPAHVTGAEILISSASGATVGAAVTTGGGAMLVKAASNGSAWICTAIIIP